MTEKNFMSFKKNREAYMRADEGLINILHWSGPNSRGQLILSLGLAPTVFNGSTVI
jgi:hypothetical protein